MDRKGGSVGGERSQKGRGGRVVEEKELHTEGQIHVIYRHTYIHTYIHTCIHTYIHTDRQTDEQTDKTRQSLSDRGEIKLKVRKRRRDTKREQ